jgi:hypothetical protein
VAQGVGSEFKPQYHTHTYTHTHTHTHTHTNTQSKCPRNSNDWMSFYLLLRMISTLVGKSDNFWDPLGSGLGKLTRKHPKKIGKMEKRGPKR